MQPARSVSKKNCSLADRTDSYYQSFNWYLYWVMWKWIDVHILYINIYRPCLFSDLKSTQVPLSSATIVKYTWYDLINIIFVNINRMKIEAYRNSRSWVRWQSSPDWVFYSWAIMTFFLNSSQPNFSKSLVIEGVANYNEQGAQNIPGRLQLVSELMKHLSTAQVLHRPQHCTSTGTNSQKKH